MKKFDALLTKEKQLRINGKMMTLPYFGLDTEEVCYHMHRSV